MSEYEGHYSKFDVMKEKEHWDPHTKKVVEKRLKTKLPFKFLSADETETLYQICSILLDDKRQPIIRFVVQHFDTTLYANIGESQRKATVPKQSILIREGIALLNEMCLKHYEYPFYIVTEDTKKDLVQKMLHGVFPSADEQQGIPMKDFILKVLQEATAAYYSHPTLWSEIGYAGPAYPRGYVRTELGLTDPWEAKSDAD